MEKLKIWKLQKKTILILYTNQLKLQQCFLFTVYTLFWVIYRNTQILTISKQIPPQMICEVWIFQEFLIPMAFDTVLEKISTKTENTKEGRGVLCFGVTVFEKNIPFVIMKNIIF